MIAGAVLLMMSTEADPHAEMIRVLCAFAAASGLAFPLVLGQANYDSFGHQGLVRFGMTLPVLLYALWLVLSYVQNQLNSVPWSYAVEMFAIICAMIGFFRVSSFAFHVDKGYEALFYAMLGTMACIMALADERYMGMQLILLSSAGMLLLYVWILVRNLEPVQEEKEGRRRRSTRAASRSWAERNYEGGFCRLPFLMEESMMDDAKLIRETTARLIDWCAEVRRPLPWRLSPTPYHVWVSEIMLQQTRIEAVIPYYARFLDALPDIPSLAAVEEDRLLKLWEGLGYYSRARNLQKAAKIVMTDFGGELPREAAKLRTLPGIGDYTAGAIASIAWRAGAGGGRQCPQGDDTTARTLG